MSLLQLKKLDPRMIGDDRCVFIINKRGVGKTTVSKCLAYYKKHIPMGLIMNGTEEATKAYAPICPDIFIFNKWEPKQVETLLARQKRQVHEGKPLSSVFLIMDDVAYDKKLFSDKVFRELIMNGRPLKIYTQVCVQYVGDLNPAIRENIDFLIVGFTPGHNLRKKYFDNFFAGLIDDFPTFCTILDATTQNHECLVLDNTKLTTKVSERLYWFKAKLDMPPFKMGSKGFWSAHDKNYDSKYYMKTLNIVKPVSVKVVKKNKQDTSKKDETKADD